uniref:Uncharacterized protein n=1 Tax=Globodera rostochiensis TaxID=31243 RepID=A0A914I6J3_GLORO
MELNAERKMCEGGGGGGKYEPVFPRHISRFSTRQNFGRWTSAEFTSTFCKLRRSKRSEMKGERFFKAK